MGRLDRVEQSRASWGHLCPGRLARYMDFLGGALELVLLVGWFMRKMTLRFLSFCTTSLLPFRAPQVSHGGTVI